MTDYEKVGAERAAHMHETENRNSFLQFWFFLCTKLSLYKLPQAEADRRAKIFARHQHEFINRRIIHYNSKVTAARIEDLGGYKLASIKQPRNEGQLRAADILRKDFTKGIAMIGKSNDGKRHIVTAQVRNYLQLQFDRDPRVDNIVVTYYRTDNLLTELWKSDWRDEGTGIIPVNGFRIQTDAQRRPHLIHHVHIGVLGRNYSGEAYRTELIELLDSLSHNRGRLTFGTNLTKADLNNYFGREILTLMSRVTLSIEMGAKYERG